MDFDRLLARQLQRIAIGIAVAGLGACDRDARRHEAVCEDGKLPENHVLDEGFLTIEVGAECPEAPEEIWHTDCCPDHVFAGEICGFTRKRENIAVLSHGYGAFFKAWDNVDPSAYYLSVEGPFDLCVYEGLFKQTDICCGRPLVQNGQAVLPEVRAGARTETAELSTTDRSRIVAYWLECARMEHASIASFARFTLDLMRLGAPAELLSAAQRAGLDEVDHAVRCFALASRLAGRELAPGPLPLHDVPALDPVATVEALVREGCVGETLAAMEAAARGAAATDPEVVHTLEVIARDEARHASLAWRTLRWMLEGDDGTLLHAAQQAFEAAAQVSDVPCPPTTAVQRAHGLLSRCDIDRVHAEAWARVLRPAMHSLLPARGSGRV